MSLDNVGPVVLDHSAVRLYKECARKFQYKMEYGYVSKKTPPYFSFGTAYHLFREHLELEWNKEKLLTEDYLDSCYLKAGEVALRYWGKHGIESPIGTTWDFLNSNRLILSLKEAFKHWKKEKNDKRIIVLATEQIFSLEMPDGTVTGGRADQVIRWNGKVWGRDFKTSSKLGDFYERTLEPNDQFTRYTWAETQLAGERVQGQVVEVLYNSKKEGPKIIQFMTSRTDYQIEIWLKEQSFIHAQIKKSRELNLFPMNESQCKFCEYHSVCKMPGEQSMLQHLKSNFKFEPWKFDREVTENE